MEADITSLHEQRCTPGFLAGSFTVRFLSMPVAGAIAGTLALLRILSLTKSGFLPAHQKQLPFAPTNPGTLDHQNGQPFQF